MMTNKEFNDVLLNDFLDAYEEEDQVEEQQEEEDQEEEDQVEQLYNVYHLDSTVVQSTSSYFDTLLDDLPVLDVCCLFFFSLCVFLLFNIFNGGNNHVGFD